MLKKLFFVASAMTLLSTSAMAIPAPYVGAGLGITANTTDNSFMGSFRGVPFNVFAGYGGAITEMFYLGGELTGTVGTASLSNNIGAKTSYSYGASLIPGVLLTDHTMVFARGGVTRSSFPDVPASDGKKSTGGVFGLGMQTNVTQNVDLRMEYDYTAYEGINNAGNSASPRSDAFNLGVVYIFD